MHDAARHPQEKHDECEHAHQAKLFTDHGKQEVGVRLRKPVQFFDAATQAHTKNFAPPDGDEGVRELVALAQGVLLAERVEIGKHPFAPPWRTGDHQAEGPHQDGGDQEEHAGVNAAQEQDAHGDDGDHQEGAHIGLGQ